MYMGGGAVNRRRGWEWQWGKNGKVGMDVVEQSEKIVRNDERHVMRTRKMGQAISAWNAHFWRAGRRPRAYMRSAARWGDHDDKQQQ